MSDKRCTMDIQAIVIIIQDAGIQQYDSISWYILGSNLWFNSRVYVRGNGYRDCQLTGMFCGMWHVKL